MQIVAAELLSGATRAEPKASPAAAAGADPKASGHKQKPGLEQTGLLSWCPGAERVAGTFTPAS
jgi:hypothetical protein